MRTTLRIGFVATLTAFLLLACSSESGGGRVPPDPIGAGGEGGAGGSGGEGTGGDGGGGGTDGGAGGGGAGGEQEPGAGGAGGTGGEEERSVAGIALSVEDPAACGLSCYHIPVGGTRRLIAEVVDERGEPIPDAPVTWKSDDPAVARVDGGLVEGLSHGWATISAAAGDHEDSLSIRIGWDAVDSLEIRLPSESHVQPAVAVGKSVVLTGVAFRGGGGGIGTFPVPVELVDAQWSVGDPAVAALEEALLVNGAPAIRIRGLQAGATTIHLTTAQASEEGLEASLVVEVLEATIAPPLWAPEGIALGVQTACAHLDGVARCWGQPWTKALGFETFDPVPAPDRPVQGASGIERLALGSMHSCGLDGEGAAWCWGANYSGELGVGDGMVFDSASALPVVGAHVFSRLVAGGSHNCAIDGDLQAWCWGSNAAGQLGAGSDDFRSLQPVAVEGAHRFTRIAAGEDFTCALDEDGAAWCWGFHRAALGIGPALALGEKHPQPQQVLGGHVFREIAASARHVCALDQSGAAWCWGAGGSGELGVPPSELEDDERSEPVRVGGERRFAALAAGLAFTCALDEEGAAWCWGAGDLGQLGGGGAEASHLPTAVFGELRFSTLVAGGNTACGLLTEGGAYCWGSGESGTLGMGEMGKVRPLPVPVLAPPAE